MTAKTTIVRVLVSAVAIGAASMAGPALEVVPAVVDFGRRTTNDMTYPFTFTLKNSGDEPLVIESVRAGCGCTKVDLPEKQIAPGAEVVLTGVLETQHFEGTTNKSIHLTTNETPKRNHALPLTIILPYDQKGLRFSPQNAKWFLARPVGDRYRALVNIENCNVEGDLHIVSVGLPDGWTCETTLPASVKPESRTFLIMTRPVGGVSGFPDHEFVLRTDCAEVPEMRAFLRHHDLRKTASAARKSLESGAQ